MRLELLDVELGLFTLAGPYDRAPLLMDLHHEDGCLLFIITKNFHQDPGHVSHEIDRIIVDHDIPRQLKRGVDVCPGKGVGIGHEI